MDLPTELVEAFVAGERDASEAVALAAHEVALRTAAAVLGSRAEAADVAQAVALIVLRRRRRLRDPAAFAGWVHRIAVREARRALASKRRRDRVERDAGLAIDSVDDVRADDALARRESARAALARLPERQRIALALRYVHDLTEAEVAQAMGCRPGTAAALLSRGRAALRASPELVEFAPSPEEPVR